MEKKQGDIFVRNLNSNTLEQADNVKQGHRSNLGLLLAGGIGAAGLLITALATPFVLPALRKHCLPYVPATDNQLTNLKKAFNKYANKNDKFLDIGSGDGRVCRLACDQRIFRQVDGVELNYLLVIYSRIMAIVNGQSKFSKFHHKDLWHFPVANYDSICIFGVESMMVPLEDYIKDSNTREQTIFACRFPFATLKRQDVIGSGIDAVWIYKICRNQLN